MTIRVHSLVPDSESNHSYFMVFVKLRPGQPRRAAYKSAKPVKAAPEKLCMGNPQSDEGEP